MNGAQSHLSSAVRKLNNKEAKGIEKEGKAWPSGPERPLF